MRALLMISLLFTLVFEACSEHEESKLTVQNSSAYFLRIDFKDSSRPGATLLIEPGQARSIAVKIGLAPFSVIAYRAYGQGQVILSESVVFRQEFTWEELQAAEFRVTIE